MAHILSNSCSSRPIRTPLKSINHASKYCINEKFHFLVLILPRFCQEKDAQNIVTGWFLHKNGQNHVTQVKLFIMTVKSLLEVQNTNNSELGCY